MTARAGWLLMMAALVLVGTPAQAEVLNPALPQRSLPSGEAQAEAGKAYADAAKHYEADRLEAALTSAKLAYAMLPNASTAGLLCQMLLEKGDKRGAFEKCLVGLSLSPSGQEEGQLLTIMNELGRGVGMGWVDIKVEPEGATVKVQDVTFEGSRVIGMTPGQYQLRVTAEGFEDATESVSISVGIPYKIKVQLAKKGSALPPNGGAEPSVKRASRGPSVTAIALLVSGGAVALAGLGVQIGGIVKQSEANDLADPSSAASQGKTDKQRQEEIADLEADADTLQKVAGPITMGLGGAVLIAGVVVLLLEDGDGGGAQATTVTPALLPGGSGGLVIGGSF